MSRLTFFFLFTFIFVGTAVSQQIEFLSSDWENPAIFEKGQNLPHAFHVPYATKDAALKDRKNRCENFQLLNGMWKFMWVETPEQVPDGEIPEHCTHLRERPTQNSRLLQSGWLLQTQNQHPEKLERQRDYAPFRGR